MTRGELINIDVTTEILFKDEEGKKFWANSVAEANGDYDCKCVVQCASYWAKYMQKMISEGNRTVADIAESTFSDVNDACGGFSGLTYTTAVFLLARSWKYGNEFLKWHNEKYGYNKGDKIVTPCRLSF